MILNSFKDMTDAEWEEIFKRRYEEEKNNPNNYSHWYQLVKDCGIKIAESKILQIPYELWQKGREYYYDGKGNLDAYNEFIKINIKDLDDGKLYNIKNGTFSNKFDGSTCFTNKSDLVEKFNLIEEVSAFFETGGNTELVIRDVIEEHFGCDHIYNGMPFRPEFRVFVDFDTKKVVYSVNYWDYDYCFPHLRDNNDKEIFNKYKNYFDLFYKKNKDIVEKLVLDKVVNSKHQGTGRWSVDIMYSKLDNEFYLIDMALAHMSAYYSKDKYDTM